MKIKIIRKPVKLALFCGKCSGAKSDINTLANC